MAVGYADQEGVIRKTNVNKYDIRFNLDQEIGNRITLRSNSFFSTIKTSMTSGTDKLANTRTSIVRHMISYKPYRSAVAEEKNESDLYDENLTTPDAWFTDYDDDSEENVFNTNLSLDIKALKWLTFRVKGGMVYKNKERAMWYGLLTHTGAEANGKAGVAGLTSRSYNTEALALFNHTFKKKHTINGTVGVVYDNKDVKRTGVVGENFFSPELRADGISNAAKLYPYQLEKTGEQLFSVLARGVYNYEDNRYVLTATFRADGSSKFDKSNRFSYFPSFALAWRINQEKWMRQFDKISNLKLRAGWGQVGNQAISPYQTLGGYVGGNNYATAEGMLEPGIIPERIPNPDLKMGDFRTIQRGHRSRLLRPAVNHYCRCLPQDHKRLVTADSFALCQRIYHNVDKQR